MEYAAIAHLSQAAYRIYKAGKDVKVYSDQCNQLANQCKTLVNMLHENSGKLIGTDFMKAIDETEATLALITRRLERWSSWGKAKSLLNQSEIKQGIDDMRKRLDQCAVHFTVMSQMDILSNQEEARLAAECKHAEVQEKLHLLLDSIRNIHAILDQPVTNIEGHMMDLQEVIHADVAEPEQRHRLQQHLLDIHRQKTELLPPIIDLTSEVRLIRDDPVNISGVFCDVYLGEWLGEEKVALKLTRGINQTPKAQKRFRKEVAIWRELQHRNVARLYGVATLGANVYAVSPWMEHGDVIRYIENNPNADRVKILREAATGLEFLHNRRFVHGDLRGANILISDAGIACITDFGLSIILEEEGGPQSLTLGYHDNCRWMAPELIKPQVIGLQSMKPNNATDVWSFGMLCLEVLTGKPPFHNRQTPAAVITDLVDGVLPARPSIVVTYYGLSDGLWILMQQCWARKPEQRPTMNVVIQRMRMLPHKQSSLQISPSSDIASPVDRIFERRPYRRQSSSISIHGGTSFAPSRSPHDPPSPHSASDSFGDSIIHNPLPKSTRRQPPNIVVSMPRNQFNAMPSSSVEVEDSPRLSLMMGDSHPDVGDDVMPVIRTGLNGLKRAPILNPEQPSPHRSFGHTQERQTSSMIRAAVVSGSTLSSIKYRKDGVIAAATLSALVERLVHASSDHRKDLEFIETFLVSFEAFTNAEEVLSLLIEQFHAALSLHYTAEESASVRYSVLKVLISWLQDHRSQAKDIPFLERMRAFTESIQHSALAPTIVASAGRVSNLIAAQVSILTASTACPLSPISLHPSLLSPAHSPGITPQSVANVLMLLEGERYSKIMASDCIGWLVGAQGDNGLSSFITENDRLSYWVKASILKPNQHSQRADERKFFLGVAEECRKLRNYSSSSAIFAGLAWSSITGLKRTAILGKSETKIYSEIDKLFSPHKNFQAYRKALEASAGSCIPILAVHLGDTKKNHSATNKIIRKKGHPDMVNFGLYHDLLDQIRQMLSFQPPLTSLSGPPPAATQMFVDNQIHAVIADGVFRRRLDQRAAILARQEHVDFVSHADEFKAAGFVGSR